MRMCPAGLHGTHVRPPTEAVIQRRLRASVSRNAAQILSQSHVRICRRFLYSKCCRACDEVPTSQNSICQAVDPSGYHCKCDIVSLFVIE